MSILFMGTPQFAAYQLEYLIKHNYPIKAVVTVPDKLAGRGQKIQESDVKKTALQYAIPILQPANLKDPEFIKQLEEMQLDLIIVVAFRMLPKAVWSLPKYGCFNLHASLLPEYRGAAPINHAIMQGEKQSGVSTFLIDEHIDTGNILLQSKVDILDSDDAGTLHDKLMLAGAELIAETIDAIYAKSVVPRKQPKNGESKMAPKIFPADCFLNAADDVYRVYNKIRGLSPYPGARIYRPTLSGQKKLLKIYKAEVSNEMEMETGKFQSDGKSFLKWQCQNGIIYLKEVQEEGKKRMEIGEYLRGIKDLPANGTLFGEAKV